LLVPCAFRFIGPPAWCCVGVCCQQARWRWTRAPAGLSGLCCVLLRASLVVSQQAKNSCAAAGRCVVWCCSLSWCAVIAHRTTRSMQPSRCRCTQAGLTPAAAAKLASVSQVRQSVTPAEALHTGLVPHVSDMHTAVRAAQTSWRALREPCNPCDRGSACAHKHQALRAASCRPRTPAPLVSCASRVLRLSCPAPLAGHCTPPLCRAGTHPHWTSQGSTSPSATVMPLSAGLSVM
jgi:hypothetical protein